jgi:undecaprenyl-diphosphatase
LGGGLDVDERLQRWTVNHRVEALDVLFVGLSRIGSLGLVWIALSLAVAAAWRRVTPLLLVVAAVVVADLVATALKLVVRRPRPYVLEPEPEPLLGTHLDLTLPSGHAGTSFAAAFVLAALLRRRVLVLPLFVLAAGIAWSRVYVGVHYPSDVLLGALLGLAVGVAVLVAWRAIVTALRKPEADPQRSPPAPPPG